MLRAITRFVDLREGELRVAAIAFFVLFGTIAGHTILETARDALFLSKLPASRLTIVYAAVALGSLVVSRWNTLFVIRFGQRRALVVTLVGAALVTAGLQFAPMHGFVLYLLYAWSGVIGGVLAVQFWMLSAQMFTVGQGKRLFGPIAGGGVLGAVVGASLAAALLTQVHVRALLFLSAAFFFATAMLLRALPRDHVVPDAPPTGPLSTAPDEGLLSTLRGSRYLQKLAAFTAFGTAALLVSDYLFKSVAAAHIPHAELGSFFARSYAVFNVLALVVQVAVAGRIVRRLGIVTALVILPLCIGLGNGAMVVAGTLLVPALLTKGADGSLRYSLHRVASELLWMPLTSDVRNRVKSALDVVFSKAMQAVVAGLLFLMLVLGAATPRILALAAVTLTAAWIATIAVLRKSYLDLLRQALARGPLDVDFGVFRLDLSSVEAVLEALSSPNPAQVIAAMEFLSENKHGRLVPGLVLYHESPLVLVRALSLVATPDRTDWIPLAERLLTHADEGVRIAAVRALSRADQVDSVRRAFDDSSPAVRAHAALAAAERGTEAAGQSVRALLALEGGDGRAARMALLDALADHPDPRGAPLVLELAEGSDAEVATHAVRAMGKLEDQRFIPWLIEKLPEAEGRDEVREALVHQGAPALEALVEALADPKTNPKVALHIPRSLSRFLSQRAADALMDILTSGERGAVRYKALRGLGRLVMSADVHLDGARIAVETRKHLVEGLRETSLAVALKAGGAADTQTGSLVLELISDKRRQAGERVFRLIQLEHKGEDIRSAYLASTSTDKRLRAQALEFLETLATDPRRGKTSSGAVRSKKRGASEERVREDIRELLRDGLDELPDIERVARGARFLSNPRLDHDHAVAELLADGDDTVATLAAFHALELGTPALLAMVNQVLETRPLLQIASSLEETPASSLRAPTEAMHAQQ